MAELPSGLPPEWVRRDLAGATGRGVRVAVIDSGRDPEWHEPRIRPGIGLVDPASQLELARSDDDRDRIGHGTACCDILLGMAAGITIVPIRVFGDQLETSPELIVAAIDWAAEERIDIVNLSLGTHLKSALEPLYLACDRARERGVLVVSAVNMSQGWSYPAVFDNVLSVQAGSFANVFDFFYRRDEAVECLAQGERDVRWLGSSRRQVSGSSFAAPHISAIVALLLESHPGADIENIRTLLSRYAVALERDDFRTLRDDRMIALGLKEE